METDVKNNWVIPSRKNEELKQVAKDLYNGLIFTDRHLSSYNLFQSCFMVFVFMGPKKPEPPKYPSDSNTKDGNRDNRIYDLLKRDQDQKEYEEKLANFPQEEENYKNYLENIGLVYEYLDKAGPIGVNGNPIFFSANILNKEDSDKMFTFYEQYKILREGVDNF
jgi:hypothetical protein